MASSSSVSRNWLYHVFLSFSGGDVPQNFLSHVQKEFKNKGITYQDPIGPELKLAVIRYSRVAVVLLSTDYTSSSWCLDELVEIMKCRKENQQKVMPIFYGVDPPHVRKQTGDFGKAFDKTCVGKQEEKVEAWRQALKDVAMLAGYHSRNLENESHMINEIASDVSRVLNSTPSKIARDISSKLLKSPYSTGMACLVVINLLLEIASAVTDQLSSIRKPYFARISLVLSIISAILTIVELAYKIRVHKARFRWKWEPMPWFYYPPRNYKRIFGSSTDTILLFCVVGQLIVSTINWSFIERKRDGPIKVSLWPLFFAIGMVCSKFMEKPPISKQEKKL